MKTNHWYHVQTPEGSFTLIGGPLEPAEPGFVFLCTPDGERLLKVSAGCVTATTREETARRIMEDAQATRVMRPEKLGDNLSPSFLTR